MDGSVRTPQPHQSPPFNNPISDNHPAVVGRNGNAALSKTATAEMSGGNVIAMAGHGGDPDPDAAEEEGGEERRNKVEEEEEEQEQFHDSLDRIISSSCSSTSASDDESAERRPSSRRTQHRLSFPSTFYDVWTAEPASVEERRKLLLQRLGLVGDPALSRPRSEDPKEMARSLMATCFSQNSPSTVAAMARSRSDNSVSGGSSFRDDRCGNLNREKPPLAKSSSSGRNNASFEEEGEFDLRDEDQKYCVIKNLDNGLEFVVKEVREDGMWNKLKEVATGRQLTMEEFKKSVIGHSPIVEELMRRQNQGGCNGNGGGDGNVGGLGARIKKRGGWLRSIRSMADNVVNGGERRTNSDEKDTSSSEKGGSRVRSMIDHSQELGLSCHGSSERVKVRQYGRSWKELTGLYLNQQIHGHSGSIWTIKFSLDGRYLASAGEDCVIHIWEVVELERKRDLLREKGLWEVDGGSFLNPFASVNCDSPELTAVMSNSERQRRSKLAGTWKSFSLDHVIVPENVFALSEKPVCSFLGHHKDVLDLSWSKSKLLLSSSMDKTVRLWDMSSNVCLKTFTHSDYVTCIQFNPVNDKFFISGSLDAKVRIWSIEHRQVVDWTDLHEMVTAVCYAPDGQGAFVGSHKGSCNFFNISDNKLQEKSEINLQNKKKKSQLKKITGFQFAPRSLSEVLITSADSRVRAVDNGELLHKFKGFRNTSSQISASITADAKHVICASEDSQVYVWRYDADSKPGRNRSFVSTTQAYEYFHCRDVSVAVAWHGSSIDGIPQIGGLSKESSCLPEFANGTPKSFLSNSKCNVIPQKPAISTVNGSHFFDRVSATWPEEKLFATTNKQNSHNSELISQIHNRSAWGMVIVTAGRGGDIKIYQNFGYPAHI